MSPPVPSGAWQRLDPRNLLLDPVRTLAQFAFPALIAFVGLSSGDRGAPWWALPIVLVGALVLGALPWLTTTWRVTESHLQRRSGILSRTTSTAPLDRIRSVDLEASLLHRVLGLAKVQVGTGVDDDRITLDAIDRGRAEALRADLLSRRAEPARPEGAAGVPGLDESADSSTQSQTQPSAPPSAELLAPVEEAPVEELARIRWSWLRFAPFSLARLVVVAGALGVLGQFGDDLPIFDAEQVASTWDRLREVALVVLLVVGLVGGLVAWTLLSVTGYAVQWWGLRLTRADGSIHQTSGLFTTRSISVEERRVRGARRVEPVLMRPLGGAELQALATGVGSGGVTALLPPCPVSTATEVADRVLEAPGAIDTPLAQHGPRARRRCHIRAQDGALLVPLVLGLGWWFWTVPGWLVLAGWAVAILVAAVVAESEYAHLGHALVDRHLVVGSGTLPRVRTALETDGIIGWVVHQGWWQRRLGLADLVATTAAGAEKVVARDVPHARALGVAHAATPGVLDEFLMH